MVTPIIPPASVGNLNTTTSLKLPSLNIKFPEIKNSTNVNITTTSVSISSTFPTQPSLHAQSSLLPKSSLHSFQTSLSAPLSLSSQAISFSSTPSNLVNSSLNTGLQQQQQQQSLTTPVLTLNPQQQQQQQQQSSTLTLRQTPSLGFSVASTVVTASISNPIVAFSKLSTPNLGTISNSVVSSIEQPTGTTGSGKGLSLLGLGGGFTVPTTAVASGGGITMKPFSLSQSLTAATATANTTLTIGNGGLQSGSFNFGLNQQSSSIFANKTNTNQQQQQQGVMSATQIAAPKPLTNIFNSQPILNQSANSLGTNLQQQNNAFNPLQTTSVVNKDNNKPSFNLGIGAATTTQLPPVGINKDSGFKISLGTNTTNVFNSQQPQMSFGNGLFNQTQQQLPAVTTTTAQPTQSTAFQFSLNKSQGISSMFGGMGQQQPQMQATSSTSFQFSKMAAANTGGGNTLGLTGTNNGGLGLTGTNNGSVGGGMGLTGNMANGGLSLTGNTLGLTGNMATNNGGLGLTGNTLGLTGNTLGLTGNTLGLTGNMATNNGGLSLTGNTLGLTGNMATNNGGLGLTGNTLGLSGTNNGGLGRTGNVGGGMGLTGNMANGGLGRTGNTPSLTGNMAPNNGGLGLTSNVGGGMGNMANGGLGLTSNKLGQQQPSFAFGNTNSQQKPQNMLQSGNAGNPAFNFTMGKQLAENQTGMFNQNTASSSFVNQNAHPNGMTQAVPGTPFGGNQSTNQNQFFQFGNKGTSTNTAGGMFNTNQSISNQPNSSFQFQSTQPSQSGFNFGTVETTPSRGVSFSAGKPRQTIQARRRKK